MFLRFLLSILLSICGAMAAADGISSLHTTSTTLCGTTTTYNCLPHKVIYDTQNRQYVAVGEDYDAYAEPMTGRSPGLIFISKDGSKDWRRAITPLDSGRLRTVIQGKNKLIAVGESGTIVSSLDGYTWENMPIKGFNNTIVAGGFYNIISVAWNYKNQYLAIASTHTGGAIVLTSSDGNTWQQMNSVANFKGVLYSVIYSKVQQKYIAIGTQGSKKFGPSAGPKVVFSSTDGLDWQKIYSDSADSVGNLWEISQSGNNEYTAVGVTLGKDNNPHPAFVTSNDGISWIENILENINGELTGITANSKGFVSVGPNYTTGKVLIVQSSSNGLKWQPYLSNFDRGYSCDMGITWSGYKFVIVGNTHYENHEHGNVWIAPTILNSFNSEAGELRWTAPIGG